MLSVSAICSLVFFLSLSQNLSFWSSKPAVPPDGISCDEGWTVVGREWIDDSYCDCADGTDESSSSACSSVAASSSRFECANEGYFSTTVPLSRVDDGFCDCCDGSDEEGGICDNVCEAVQAAERAERERIERERAAGIKVREEYVSGWARESAERASSLERAKKEKERLANLVESELRPRVEAYDAAEASRREERESAHAAHLDEAFSKAAAHEVRMAAVKTATAAGEVETLLDVVMHSAGLDDTITDSIDDVEVLSLGVDAHEALKGKEGASVEAFETACASIASALSLDLVSVDAARSVILQTLRAARDTLEREGALVSFGQGAGDLINFLFSDSAASSSGEGEDAEGASPARSALATASDELKQVEDQIKRLSEKSRGPDVLGPDSAFGPIQDSCYSARVGKYEYELCIFGKAKQDQISLGRFVSWDDDNFTTMIYKHGQHCPGAGARELAVSVECGSQEELVDVAENEVCRYSAIFKTPAACR